MTRSWYSPNKRFWHLIISEQQQATKRAKAKYSGLLQPRNQKQLDKPHEFVVNSFCTTSWWILLLLGAPRSSRRLYGFIQRGPTKFCKNFSALARNLETFRVVTVPPEHPYNFPPTFQQDVFSKSACWIIENWKVRTCWKLGVWEHESEVRRPMLNIGQS